MVNLHEFLYFFLIPSLFLTLPQLPLLRLVLRVVVRVGIGNFGCYAHVALRRALCAMFWVDEADHQPDYEVDQLDPNSATMALAMHRKDQKHRRGNDTTLHYTTQHNTTQHNTTQHNTAQHNTTQHNTTQHSRQPSTLWWR